MPPFQLYASPFIVPFIIGFSVWTLEAEVSKKAKACERYRKEIALLSGHVRSSENCSEKEATEAETPDVAPSKRRRLRAVTQIEGVSR